MKASELIVMLQRLVDDEGDPEVHVTGYYTESHPGDPITDVIKIPKWYKASGGWAVYPIVHCVYRKEPFFSMKLGREFENEEAYEAAGGVTGSEI